MEPFVSRTLRVSWLTIVALSALAACGSGLIGEPGGPDAHGMTVPGHDGGAVADGARPVTDVPPVPVHDGGTMPGVEVCDNGLDDDGDGRVDQGCPCLPGATQRCYAGPRANAGVGACRQGMQACAGEGEFGTWGPCEGSVLPRGEQCDETDDDCDGAVDNGCACRPDETRSCYDGPTGTRGVGICRDGTATCAVGAGSVGSAWGACSGAVQPGTEICDGLDNDCDGTVDEGCTCGSGAERACYGGPAGTAGVGPCHAGRQDCSVEHGMAAWGACSGEALPSAEVCDGVDNDCDGNVDDGCACAPGTTRACYTGPTGTRGVGTCRAGTQSCVAGAGGVGSAWGTCTGQTLPASERCDEADNNCDGTVDDGCACRTGQSRACYTGPTGTSGVGLCRAGTQACVVANGVATFGPCTGEVHPASETCDDADNDCDGMVDDGCACTPDTVRPCYGGPTGTVGVGTCRAGSQTCVPGASGVGSAWGTCGGAVIPAVERCNGVDDDCDGAVDEGFGVTSCGTGACRRTVDNCASGRMQSCMPGGPASELCNGLDDDCNGTVDDGLPPVSCGVGACHRSVASCVNGHAQTCSPGTPTTEACNGLDDDCDGLVDDGIAPVTCGTGACQRTVAGCTQGSATACVPGAPGVEACDSVDNDCDGMVDEGCTCTPGTTRACYTGPAGTATVGTCHAGMQACTAVATGGSSWGACTGQVLPGPAVCDGLDHACSGTLPACPPVLVCPAAVVAGTVAAGATLHATASTTPPATVATYSWSVTSAPAGTTWRFGAPASPDSTFEGSDAGTYVLRLTVTDSRGHVATCGVTVTLAASPIRALDVLVVVDNSVSMEGDQALLGTQVGGLVSELTSPPDRDGDGAPDYPAVRDLHVGVVSTDLGTPGATVGGCAVSDTGDDGRLNPIRYGAAMATHEPWVTAPAGFRPTDCSDANEYPAFLFYTSGTTSEVTFEHDFRCNALLYANGCGFEQTLESAWRALIWYDARAVAGNTSPNAGFVRTEAVLAIVVLSDEDDVSVRDCRYAHGMPCTDATTVFQTTSTAWGTTDLSLRQFAYAPGSAQDPTWPLERYHNPADSRQGLLSLKPGHPERIVFAAITGVPIHVPTLAGGATDWNLLLGSPVAGAPDNFDGRDSSTSFNDPGNTEGPISMRQDNLDPACAINPVPSCRREGTTYVPGDCDNPYRAAPSRRIVEVARRFDQAPVCLGRACGNGMVRSICAANYASAIDDIASRIGSRLTGRR